MREKGGLDVILASMPKFELNHQRHIAVYGSGNERRLTGNHETGRIDQVSKKKKLYTTIISSN